MGCDIHVFVEVKCNEKWEYIESTNKKVVGDYEYISPLIFDCRSYALFGFLANVRNYSKSPVISPPRGIPENLSCEVKKAIIDYGFDGHSHSYLYVSELINFPYKMLFWNMRVTRQEKPGYINGAAQAYEDEGEKLTLHEFIGDYILEEMKKLEYLGKPEDIRIVFFFDN